MSSPSFPTLDEVVENIMEEVLREEAKQLENQETAPEELREENEEVEVEGGEALVFFIGKGAEDFQKNLTKKGFEEERGFKEIASPFKEEIKRRGWEAVCKHLELGRRALVKEFYPNLGDRRN